MQVNIHLRIAPSADAKSASVSLQRWHLPDTATLSLTRPDPNSGDIPLGGVGLGGEGVVRRVAVAVEDVTVPHAVRGALHYTVVSDILLHFFV